VGLLSLLRVHSGLPWLATALFVYGLAIGQLIGVLVMVVQNAAPAHQLGVATTAVRLFQTLGGALGASIFGAVLSHAFAARYPVPGHPGVGALARVPADERARALAALVSALDTVFSVAALVMLLGVLLAALLWRTRPLPPGATAPAPAVSRAVPERAG
jgi:hypothetical protein